MLCHNFSQRSSGSTDIRFPDLSSVKIAIIFISHTKRVFKLTLGQDLLGALKAVPLNNPLQETFPQKITEEMSVLLRNEAPVRCIYFGNVNTLFPFKFHGLQDVQTQNFGFSLCLTAGLYIFHSKPLLPLIKSCEAEGKHEILVSSGTPFGLAFWTKDLMSGTTVRHQKASEKVSHAALG